MPQTGFEKTGTDWSTLAEERAFLEQVAAETDLRLTAAGESVLGNPIWRAEIGNQTGPALMVVGGVHGRELSGREASMMWLRELAYSSDPDIVAYLATYRVVVVPNCNADGAEMFTRNNSNGINLNRDYAELTQPETRAVKSVFNAVQPQIVWDLHEVDATLDAGADWRPYAAGLPGTHQLIQAAADACLGSTKAAVSTAGYTNLDYLRVNMPWGGMSTLAGAFHSVGILSEPSMRLPRSDRVDVSLTLLRATMEWHRDHQADLNAAIAASKAAAIASDEPIQIPGGPYLPNTEKTIPGSGSYAPDWVIPQELLDLHGLVVTDGVLELSQEARLLVAHLFDPDSFEYVVGNPWWEPQPEPVVGVVSSGFSVKLDGVIRSVREVWHQQSGVRRRVSGAWVKRGGVRRRV